MGTSGSFRLPTDVRPVKYRLSLRPDLDAATFQGDETVDIEISETHYEHYSQRLGATDILRSDRSVGREYSLGQ